MNSGGLKWGSVCLHSIITERQLRVKSLQRLLAILHWTITGLEITEHLQLSFSNKARLTKIIFLRVKKIEILDKYAPLGISVPGKGAGHNAAYHWESHCLAVSCPSEKNAVSGSMGVKQNRSSWKEETNTNYSVPLCRLSVLENQHAKRREKARETQIIYKK